MGCKVHLWGDSIGKGVFFQEERQRYCLAAHRCSRILEEAGVALESHARMGATVIDGYADFAQTETLPGEVAVIEFGGNDCDLDWLAVAAHPEGHHDGKVPLAIFREKLQLFVRAARQRGLRPMLVTPPPLYARRYFDWVTRTGGKEQVLQYLGDVEHIYRWQERYALVVREVAYEEQCPLADVREIFLARRDFSSLMSLDGIHPNEAGQELMGQTLREKLPVYQEALRGA